MLESDIRAFNTFSKQMRPAWFTVQGRNYQNDERLLSDFNVEELE